MRLLGLGNGMRAAMLSNVAARAVAGGTPTGALGDIAATDNVLILRLGQSNADTASTTVADATTYFGSTLPFTSNDRIWVVDAAAWQTVNPGVNTSRNGLGGGTWSTDLAVMAVRRAAGHTGRTDTIKEHQNGNGLDPKYGPGHWYPGGSHPEGGTYSKGTRVAQLENQLSAAFATGVTYNRVIVLWAQGEKDLDFSGASAVYAQVLAMLWTHIKSRPQISSLPTKMLIERIRPTNATTDTGRHWRGHLLRAGVWKQMADGNLPGVEMIDTDACGVGYPANDSSIHPRVGSPQWMFDWCDRVKAWVSGTYDATYGPINDVDPGPLTLPNVTQSAGAAAISDPLGPLAIQQKTTIATLPAGVRAIVRAWDGTVITDWTNTPGFIDKFWTVQFEYTGHSSGSDTTLNIEIGPRTLAWRVLGAASGSNVAPSITQPPVAGPAVVGGQPVLQTAAVANGTPTPTITYQWKLAGVNIAANYTFLSGDIGKAVTTVAAATNSEGSDTATSAAVTVSSDTFAPEITAAAQAGTATVGAQPVLAFAGSANGIPTPSLTHQWKMNGVNITSDYTFVPGDLGKSIVVVLTATNSQGSASDTSDAVLVQAAAAVAPTITAEPVAGAAIVGSQPVLSTAGTATGTPAPTLTHQWKVDGANIASDYTFVPGDVGKSVTVTLTATNTAGSASSTSTAVTVTAASVGYRSDTQAWIDRLAVVGGAALTTPQKTALDAFYAAGAADLWMPEMVTISASLGSELSARLCLKDPNNLYTQGAAPMPWDQVNGFKSTANNQHVITNINPSVALPQNSIGLAAWLVGLSDASPSHINSDGGTSSIALRVMTSGTIRGALHSGGAAFDGTVASNGMYMANRSASNAVQSYGPDGNVFGAPKTTPSAAPNSTTLIIGMTGVTHKDSGVNAFAAFKSLTAAQAMSLRNAMAALMAAF